MIAIVDYGMGNLRSVQKAVEHVGGRARIVQMPAEVDAAEKVILPGVGAFGDAIGRLREAHLDAALVRAIGAHRPFLGICLGLQLLFDVSYEDGRHAGLGVLGGEVVRFEPPAEADGRRLPVPHMGWNRIRWQRPCPLLRGLAPEPYVYFVHSYYVVPRQPEVTLTTTEYAGRFVSAVWRDNLFATQFHPEKSQQVGLTMLRNFVAL